MWGRASGQLPDVDPTTSAGKGSEVSAKAMPATDWQRPFGFPSCCRSTFEFSCRRRRSAGTKGSASTTYQEELVRIESWNWSRIAASAGSTASSVASVSLNAVNAAAALIDASPGVPTAAPTAKASERVRAVSSTFFKASGASGPDTTRKYSCCMKSVAWPVHAVTQVSSHLSVQFFTSHWGTPFVFASCTHLTLVSGPPIWKSFPD